jgi:hypothetical protein
MDCFNLSADLRINPHSQKDGEAGANQNGPLLEEYSWGYRGSVASSNLYEHKSNQDQSETNQTAVDPRVAPGIDGSSPLKGQE